MREPDVREEPARRAGPAGDERLTAMTGAVLLVLDAGTPRPGGTA